MPSEARSVIPTRLLFRPLRHRVRSNALVEVAKGSRTPRELFLSQKSNSPDWTRGIADQVAVGIRPVHSKFPCSGHFECKVDFSPTTNAAPTPSRCLDDCRSQGWLPVSESFVATGVRIPTHGRVFAAPIAPSRHSIRGWWRGGVRAWVRFLAVLWRRPSRRN